MLKGKICKLFRISALMLATVLLLTGVLGVSYSSNPFAYNVKADEVLTVTLGEAQKSGNIVTFPEATISGASSITSMMFYVTKGYIVGEDWDFKDILTWHKTTTKVWTSGTTLDSAQNFLRSVQFGYEEGMKVTVKADANEMHLPNSAKIAAFEPVEGAGHHYYMFVPTSTGGDPGWKSAYNNAKQWTFMGMKGYLATITSKEEDRTLDDISLAGAWAGGARINNSITALDADTSSGYAPVYPTTATSWKWVCGPEAGQLLYLDSRCRAATEGCGYARDGYANWGTDTKTGIPNQPDGYAANSSNLGEWNLQLHFSNAGNQSTWNDLPETYPSLITGYYVEFSDYAGGHVASYESSKTASATAEHVHSWGYTTKTSSDGNSSEALAYCLSDPNMSLCPYSGEQNALTVSLAAEDVPYTGNVYDAETKITVTGADALNAKNGATCSSVVFYNKGRMNLTDSSDGAASNGAAPSKVGTYYAEVTITDKDDSTKTAVAMDTFSIGKGTYPQGTVTASMSGYSYGDTPSNPLVSGIPAGENPEITYWYYRNDPADATEWDENNPPKLDAGEYHMVARIGESESFASIETEPVGFTVSKKVISNLNWDDLDLIYNGENQKPTVTIPAAEIVGSDVINITVTGEQKDVGTHTATAAIDNDNYEIDSSIVTKTFEISKSQLLITAADQTIAEGKTIISDKAVIKFWGLCASDTPESIFGSDFDKIKVKCETDDYSAAGSYTLLVEFPAGLSTTNYELQPVPGTLTVSKNSKGTKIDSDPASGQVIPETIKEQGLPETEITNMTKSIAISLLNDEEKEAVRTGSDVLVYLDLTDATSDVTVEEIKKFEETKSEKYELYEDMILDLSLYKRTITGGVSSEPVKLETIDKEIYVEVELPEELINKDKSCVRSYQVIRKHTVGMTDTYEKIPAQYLNGKIRFKTNKFSDYVIAYCDTKKSSGSGSSDPDDGSGSGATSGQAGLGQTTVVTPIIPVLGAPLGFVSPKTGDTKEVYAFAALLIAGIAMIFCGHKKKGKKL